MKTCVFHMINDSWCPDVSCVVHTISVIYVSPKQSRTPVVAKSTVPGALICDLHNITVQVGTPKDVSAQDHNLQPNLKSSSMS